MGGKTMSDADTELGPVDYLVVAFPAGQAKFSGEMASELRALIDSNTVRVLDLVLVTKDVDGSVEASELRDADDSEVGQLRAAEADLAVLLAESDIEEIGGVLELRPWSTDRPNLYGSSRRLSLVRNRAGGSARRGPVGYLSRSVLTARLGGAA
jgi:hypothetical protein